MPEFATIPQPNGKPRTRRVVRYDPNDRLERLGPQAVKDIELLGYAIGNEERAEMILNDWPKENLIDMDLEAVCRLGVSRKKAKVLIAAFELARRSLHKGLGVRPVISAPADSLHYLTHIKDEQREHFITLYLNARHQIVHQETTSIGSLSSAIVHPREVFRLAVEHSAASVILAHNHPSGDVSPS